MEATPRSLFFMHQHKCIKCKAPYVDSDPEPYLCKACDDVRAVIAREVDEKIGSTAGQTPHSDLTVYDQILKTKGRVSIKDLGIVL